MNARRAQIGKSSTLETSKNHLIRNFLRNGFVRVKVEFLFLTVP